MFNPQHRLKMLSVYPERYEEPQMLTTPEIDDPWLVIEAFFDGRRLSQWRMDMELLREDLLVSDSEELSNHLYILKETEKLMEAVAVMFDRHRQECMAEADAGPDRPEAEEDGPEQPARRVLLFDTAVDAPWPSLSEVYRNFPSRELVRILEEWKDHAISCSECYSHAQDRAGLLDFSKAFKKLLDGVHALWLVHRFESRSGLDLHRPVNLQAGLLRKEADFGLTDEELYEPAAVIEEFFERYSPRYAKGELWNLAECVQGETKAETHNKALPAFECMMAVVVAAWTMLKTKEEKDEGE